MLLAFQKLTLELGVIDIAPCSDDRHPVGLRRLLHLLMFLVDVRFSMNQTYFTLNAGGVLLV